ncbi:hypothetical protein [Vibrio phage vB_VpS_PG28]|nr:hypothetical protein [Vibrio phage vB_VpS_PG28]
MMSSQNKTFGDIYSDKEVHSGSPKGLCYNEDLDMENKFKQIAGIIARATDRVAPTILDVGCGYSTLLSVYDKFHKYTGVDTTEWIHKAAEATADTVYGGTDRREDIKHHLGTLSTVDKKLTPTYDVVMAIGVMATMNREIAKDFMQELAAKAGKFLVLGYQSVELSNYHGSLNSQTFDEVREATGMRVVEIQTIPDTTEILVLLSK